MMTPKILFFTAVLFASAAVGYPANEIDWGKGRPGVRVVTNAPSRAEFDALVSGNSQYATWAANASNANYASVSALSSNSLLAVTVTGPQSNAIANAASVAYVDMLTQTNRVKIVWDYENQNNFTRFVNGTGIVYGVTNVSYWHRFGETEHLPLSYPITDYTDGSVWFVSVNEGFATIQDELYFADNVPVTATNFELYYLQNVDPLIISTNTYIYEYILATNVLDVLATTSQVGLVNSVLTDQISNLSAVVSASNSVLTESIEAVENSIGPRTFPPTLLLYGDLNTTNTPGYSGYTIANGSASSVTLVPTSTITTNTASFEYQIASNGFVSATAIAQASGVSGTFGSSVMTLLDANDVPLASNTFTAGTFTSAATGRPYFTNSLTYSAGFVTNAKLRVSYTIWRTNTSAFASQLFTGTTYPMTLTCKTAPLPYVTFDQSEYVTQSQLTAYPTFPQVTNIVQEAGQSWIEVDIGALRASFTGTPASVGQLEGTTYGVVGLSNAVSACAFGLLSLRPMEESKTNLVLCVCSSSGLSLDNQATYSRFTCVSWTNTSVTVYESYPTFTNGVSTATLRIPVYRNVSINHTQLAAQPQDTARDRTVFNVRYRWE